MTPLLTWLILLLAAAGPQQRDVQTIVRALEARYRTARTLQATFLERYSEDRNSVRVESGTVSFSRPGRMRWEYESPEEKLFLVDGVNVWFYVPADRTATRAKIRQSADWRTPLAVLTGKVALRRFCGRIELADERVRPDSNVTLRCLPRTARRSGHEAVEDAPFKEVLLEVDVAYRVVRVLVREAAGIETEFRFADWRENIPLPEAIFHFQPPIGVAIVDEASIAGPIR